MTAQRFRPYTPRPRRAEQAEEEEFEQVLSHFLLYFCHLKFFKNMVALASPPPRSVRCAVATRWLNI